MYPRRTLPWRKVLYEDQGYADNYTAPSFLTELQKNRSVRIVSYAEAIYGASKLQQQLSLVVVFLMIFHLMYTNNVQPELILFNAICLAICGYVYAIVWWPGVSLRSFLVNSKIVASVLVFGFIFAPLLHTLTASISTDTIFSLTFVIMVIHLIFFDYGLDNAYMASKAISLNAAIFATICLSSRLNSTFHTFVLLTISIVCFVLLPIFLKNCFYNRFASILYSFILATATIHLLHVYTITPLVYTYATIVGFITIVCPVIFVRQQKFKDTKHGPWEEAIVSEADLLMK